MDIQKLLDEAEEANGEARFKLLIAEYVRFYEPYVKAIDEAAQFAIKHDILHASFSLPMPDGGRALDSLSTFTSDMVNANPSNAWEAAHPAIRKILEGYKLHYDSKNMSLWYSC